MVTNNNQTTIEPTLEFNEQCVHLLRQWRANEIPFQDAIEGLTQLSKSAEAERHTANWGRAEHLLGYMQHYRGNLNTSINHYDRAYRLFARINNRTRMATMDLNQGENYRNKGEFMRARRLYRSAYEAAYELEDIGLQAMALTNEGLVLISMNDLNAAREALLDALELSQQWHDDDQLPMLHCEIHHGLATIYLTQDDLQQAWEQALLALGTAEFTKEALQIGYANRILGDVLTAKKVSKTEDGKSIDDYYRASIQAFKDIRAEGESARSMFAQAKSFAARNKRLAAAKMFHSAMVIFSKLGMTDDVAKAAEANLSML